MDISVARQAIEDQWQSSVLERLQSFIRIPNQSPLFDQDWEKHGHMERAVQLVADWCKAQPIPGMTVKCVACRA